MRIDLRITRMSVSTTREPWLYLVRFISADIWGDGRGPERECDGDAELEDLLEKIGIEASDRGLIVREARKGASSVTGLPITEEKLRELELR